MTPALGLGVLLGLLGLLGDPGAATKGEWEPRNRDPPEPQFPGTETP